ncbi:MULTISPECIES: hypothetical protein [Hymenobacter]|uniref:hypothetical protein n=1 Tax=Hymenobacter TaxID=89966 RepID=UPI0010587E17|nr:MULTISPECIES: hypothetical protein [Hymenobacter]QIL78284.1 hypothetical protein G7064_20910 [Hymenobacter sp. HDW8]
MISPSLLRPHRNLAPVVGLLILSAYTISSPLISQLLAEGRYSYFSVTAAHYLGFACLLGTVVLYLCFRPFFWYALLITLLLGLFNLVNFMPLRMSVGLTFGSATVGFDPLSFVVLLAYYFLHKTAADSFLRKHLHSLLPQPSPAHRTARWRESVDQFKQTFARKTDEALGLIVTEQKMVPAAVTAARELLQERNSNDLAVQNS